MSLFKTIGKIAGRFVPGVGAVLTAREGLRAARRARGAAGTAVASPLSRLPTVVRRGGGAVIRQLPGVAAGAVVGSLLDRNGQPVKKRRRMNPCNSKALTRALRRIESFNRVQKRVEKSLRKACPPTRRRAPPSRKC